MADPWAEFFPKQSAPTTADPWAEFFPKKPETGGEIATDVAKSGGVGIGKGTIGLFGMMGDIPSLIGRGLTYGAAKGAEKIGILPAGKTAEDFVRASDKLTSDMEAKQGKGIVPAIEKVFTAPTSQEIQKTIENDITGPFYKPKSAPGRFAESVGELVPGAVTMPGRTIPNIAKFAMAPGVAAATAGEISNQNPWAKLSGGVGATMIAAALGRPNIANRMTAARTESVTPAQWDDADRLMRAMQARGVQLTPAEALQQVTNSATGMGSLQRIVESSTEGSNRLAPMMAERPNQVAGAVNQTLDRISPMTAPTTTAIGAQNAADASLGNIRQQINAAESPYYRAANTRTVPPGELRFIAQDPAFQRAFQNVRNDPIRNKDIANFGANEVPTLIAVRKELARMEQNALSPGMAGNPDRELARGITPIQQRLDQIITQSAPEYGQALGVGAGLREQVLDPAIRGPLGQISQSDDLAKQIAALFPSKPFEGTAGETARTIGVLNTQDARVAPALARQHLAQNFAEASQNLQSGMNQYGGAKFAGNIQGNPLQRQVLEGNLAALPNGNRVLPEVQQLLRGLEATGKRQQPGSLTAFNTEALSDMKRGGANAIYQALTKPAARAQEAAGRAQLNIHMRRMAELLASGPDGLAQIRELSRNGTGTQRALAQALIGTVPQVQSRQ